MTPAERRTATQAARLIYAGQRESAARLTGGMPCQSPSRLRGPGIARDGRRDVAPHPPEVFGQVTQPRDTIPRKRVRSSINHEPII
jgi:hypothetical protein